MHSIEAIIKSDGQVVLNETIRLNRSHRAIVTILDEGEVSSVTLLSEAALATDWDRTEEDEAWAHLQGSSHVPKGLFSRIVKLDLGM